jgi:hypothetical protein
MMSLAGAVCSVGARLFSLSLEKGAQKYGNKLTVPMNHS